MDKENKRTAYLIVRVNEAEKRAIQDQADKRGLSISAFLRMVALGGRK